MKKNKFLAITVIWIMVFSHAAIALNNDPDDSSYAVENQGQSLNLPYTPKQNHDEKGEVDQKPLFPGSESLMLEPDSQAIMISSSSEPVALPSVRPDLLNEISGTVHADLLPEGIYSTYLFSGAATYTYAFDLPQGIRITPSLGLSYNHHMSQSRSEAGNGWSLLKSYIARDVNGTIDDTDDDEFILSLNGISSKLSFDGQRYHTKTETFWRINSSGDQWEVATKDGTRHIFGKDNVGKITSSYGYTSRWHIIESIDTYQNKIEYDYMQSGYPFLKSISYSGYTVSLSYDEGYNGFEGLSGGAMVTQDKLLKRVRISYNDVDIRSYEINYTEAENTMLLESITLTGSDGASNMPPVIFEYHDADEGWSVAGDYMLPKEAEFGTDEDEGVRIFDIDGDGFDDIVKSKGPSGLQYWLSERDGNFLESSYSSIGLGGFVDQYEGDMGVRILDINSDGLMDMLKLHDGLQKDTREAFINKGDGFEMIQIDIPSSLFFTKELEGEPCNTLYCPQGFYPITGASCDSGTCSVTCERRTCSASGRVVYDSIEDDPYWNDNDQDEDGWSSSFTPGNGCYLFEYTGSTRDESDDSKCYDLYTDDDYDPGDYDEDCRGDDIDAYASIGFYGNGKSSTWLSTLPGGQYSGYIGNVDNGYYDHTYIVEYDLDAVPDSSGSNRGDWDGFNRLICDEAGTYSIYCAPDYNTCRGWGTTPCGYGCVGERTRAFIVLGVYVDVYGDLNDALNDFWQCGTIDDNDYFGRDNHYKVTEYDAVVDQAAVSCNYDERKQEDLGVRIGDVNGDGRADLVEAGPSGSVVYLGTGKGFIQDESWAFPQALAFVDSQGKDMGVRLSDVNADGYADIVKAKDTVTTVYINTGKGWETGSSWSYPTDAVFVSGVSDMGVTLVDVNGDRLPDIVKTKTPKTVFINSGRGWNKDAGWPVPDTADLTNSATKLSDFNGDGLIDFSYSPYGGGHPYINRNSENLLLKKVSNSLGGTTEISYKKIANLDNTGSDGISDLPFRGYVVSSIETKNGMDDGHDLSHRTDYDYEGGKFDPSTREFRGFKTVTEKLPDESIVVHEFLQGEYDKGLESDTKIEDSSLSYSVSRDVSVLDNDGYGIVKIDSVSVSASQSDSSRTIKESYSYDDYGNIISTQYLGDVSLVGDEHHVARQFVYDEDAYIIGLLESESVIDGDGATVSRADYDYNPQGDVISVEYYNDRGASPIEHYSYDSFGNIISHVDSMGEKTAYSYSRDGRLLLNVTNPLGHVVHFSYDEPRSLLVKETDVNGIETSYSYDPFGRIVKAVMPLDNSQYPTRSYSYEMTGNAPSQVGIKLRESPLEPGTLDTIYEIDGFGLTTSVLKESADGIVASEYFYDFKGRLVKEILPRTAAEKKLAVKYNYDILGRPVKTVNPDGTSTTTDYGADSYVDTNENGNWVEYQTDAYGRIIKIIEKDNVKSYRTYYGYDALGNLVWVRNDLGQTLKYEYDTLGNLISMDDPDLGYWMFDYDSNGNVVKETDANDAERHYNYDSLGRIISERAGSGSVSYTYDEMMLGTLSSIDGERFTKKLEYDERYRISSNSLSIGDESYMSSYTYDSLDRVVGETYPSQKQIEFAYGSSGQLSGISDFISSINYDSRQNPVEISYENGLKTQRQYDAMGRVSSVKTGEIQDTSYDYDNAGNLEAKADNAASITHSYSYDGIERLVSYDGAASIKYAYNSAGNILSVKSDDRNITYVYGARPAHSPLRVSGFENNYGRAVEFRDNGGVAVCYFDEGGNVYSRGVVEQESIIPLDERDLFRIKHGNKVIFKVGSKGALHLSGILMAMKDELNVSDEDLFAVIADGEAVMKVDIYGNLYLAGEMIS